MSLFGPRSSKMSPPNSLADTGVTGDFPNQPWVNRDKAIEQKNAGMAGKSLHKILKQSQSIGLGKKL